VGMYIQDDYLYRYASALLIRKIINRAKQKEYYNNHKDQCRKYINVDKQRVNSRTYLRNHPDKARLNAKRWRENNPEKAKEVVKRWRNNNPEKMRLIDKRKKFRRRNAIGNFTFKEWENKLKEFNNCCAYCKKPLNENEITIDHKIPLSRGGTNYIENLVPSCMSCNSKKGKRTPEEFIIV